MKANDLMVGDYVLYDGLILKVGGLTDYDIKIDLLKGDELYAQFWDEDTNNIQGIPITTEFLEKNLGVVESSSDGYNLVINRELILAFHLKATLDIWIAQPRDWPHLTYSLPLPRYVHELQHALRLCGIEKEIVI